MRSIDDVWASIKKHEGEVFRQVRGGEFKYTVVGSSVVPDRTNQTIPRAHFEKALRLMPLSSTVPVQDLRGPSYIYAILMDGRIHGAAGGKSGKGASFAAAGSQRWLQIAVARSPALLDESLRRAGAINTDDSVDWKCPVEAQGFVEYRDEEVLRCLGIKALPKRTLAEFWPRRGPVWDALGTTKKGLLVLVEAKAHIPEAASPPSQATETSLKLIRKSLEEARAHYAPRAKADWSRNLYQYANRLAFQYLFSHVNKLPTRLVFLDFYNAPDVESPESEAEWKGATRLIHALLGLPADLTSHGVFHAYVDARRIAGVAL
jgi:hypothetical protein